MTNRFLLLDAARLKQNLDEAKALNPSCISLYTGEMEAQLVNVFPFLFSFDDHPEFANWYFENGWGQSWGVIILSEYDIRRTADHLKKHILVNTENGKEYFFRFYDPRVLRVFLPTCNTKQLKEFFGPVEQFICEDNDPDFGLIFTFDENNLMTTRINKGDIL
ncbi:MAG: DUF4123 domain-containing protein [Ferruginibacter sp.]|nr:DUF4123 domain-containing protein [Chitinophagaceae bacterium]